MAGDDVSDHARAEKLASDVEQCDREMMPGNWRPGQWRMRVFYPAPGHMWFIMPRGNSTWIAQDDPKQRWQKAQVFDDGRGKIADVEGVCTLRNLAPEIAATIRGLLDAVRTRDERVQELEAALTSVCDPSGSDAEHWRRVSDARGALGKEGK